MTNLPQVPARETARMLQIIAAKLRDNYNEEGKDQGQWHTTELDLAEELDAIVVIEYKRVYNEFWKEYNTTIIYGCYLQYEDTERHLNATEIAELEMYLIS